MTDDTRPKRVFIQLASDDRVITVGELDAVLVFRADGTELFYIPPDDATDPDDPGMALQSMVKAQIATIVLSNEKLCEEILAQAGFESAEDDEDDEDDEYDECDCGSDECADCADDDDDEDCCCDEADVDPNRTPPCPVHGVACDDADAS